LSALTVLSNEDVRDKFVVIDGLEEWRNCGAFCVKFYDEGKEDIIIVDDHFVCSNGRFAFCQTVTHELWPIVLEKAYAKKFGTFSIIEGGLIDNALADLTNGIPKRVEKDQNNI
jgi:hypothetical protein